MKKLWKHILFLYNNICSKIIHLIGQSSFGQKLYDHINYSINLAIDIEDICGHLGYGLWVKHTTNDIDVLNKIVAFITTNTRASIVWPGESTHINTLLSNLKDGEFNKCLCFENYIERVGFKFNDYPGSDSSEEFQMYMPTMFDEIHRFIEELLIPLTKHYDLYHDEIYVNKTIVEYIRNIFGDLKPTTYKQII